MRLHCEFSSPVARTDLDDYIRHLEISVGCYDEDDDLHDRTGQVAAILLRSQVSAGLVHVVNVGDRRMECGEENLDGLSGPRTMARSARAECSSTPGNEPATTSCNCRKA